MCRTEGVAAFGNSSCLSLPVVAPLRAGVAGKRVKMVGVVDLDLGASTSGFATGLDARRGTDDGATARWSSVRLRRGSRGNRVDRAGRMRIDAVALVRCRWICRGRHGTWSPMGVRQVDDPPQTASGAVTASAPTHTVLCGRHSDPRPNRCGPIDP